MTEMSVLEYLRYPFVRHALAAGTLVALCSSLLGVTLVLRRFSLLGDGLSHVAFGALAIAAALHLTMPIPFVMLATAVAAVLLLAGGARSRIRGDASTAVLSVGALAVGYMLLNIFKGSPNVAGDVCSTLFGSASILTLDRGDVWICGAVSAATAALYAWFHDRVFAVTFDEDLASVGGLSARACNFAVALTTAVVVTVSEPIFRARRFAGVLTFFSCS